MDVQRRLRKNKLNIDIKDIKNFISSSNDTIKRIKNTNMGEEYISNYTDKLNKSIFEKNDKLLLLETELINTINGNMDDTINKEFTKQSNDVKTKQTASSNAKCVKKEERKVNKDIADSYWKKVVTANKEQKQKIKDMKYAYNYLNKVCDTIPPYMQKNLDNMPGNKGFIWRGVHLYGSLPEQSGPRVMTEKKGNNQIIYENTPTTCKIFERKGKDKKHIIYSRNKINVS
jgi:hypothetical protein